MLNNFSLHLSYVRVVCTRTFLHKNNSQLAEGSIHLGSSSDLLCKAHGLTSGLTFGL